ncbi:MAG: hypothetical protein ACI8YI_002805, partial [Paracoccaceae bacterium]
RVKFGKPFCAFGDVLVGCDYPDYHCAADNS